MRLPLRRLNLKSILLLIVNIIWCEYGYHHYILQAHCPGWPQIDGDPSNLTKILVISDTHIMGPIKSYLIDKMRREWEMHQSFVISVHKYKPDLLIFLGDSLDEGGMLADEYFEKCSQDFNQIFSTIGHEKKLRRLMIAGNHDIGFHNTMLVFPYLLERFSDKMGTTAGVEMIKYNDLNIILTNSMSFYNDTCRYCSTSRAQINRISKTLKGQSRPILLTHIPIYRATDISCDYPSWKSEAVKRPNIQGKDVLHEEVSNFLLDQLKPRLVLSGHTHMNCDTLHGKEFKELTVTSYNHKFAYKRPGFLQVTANSTNIETRFCPLIDEIVVLIFYIATLVVVLFVL